MPELFPMNILATYESGLRTYISPSAEDGQILCILETLGYHIIHNNRERLRVESINIGKPLSIGDKFSKFRI